MIQGSQLSAVGPAQGQPAHAVYPLPEQIDDRTTRVLMAIAAFLLSWRAVRSDLGNFTGSDLAFTILAIHLVHRRLLSSTPFGTLTATWTLGLITMLSGLLIGSLINGEIERWLNGALQYSFAFLLVPMVLMSVSRGWLRYCGLLFVVGVAVSQVIGITASFFFDYRDTYYTIDQGFLTPSGRVGALSGEPNMNGAVCAFAFPMLINAAQKHLVKAPLAILLAIILLAGLLFSASFTGFVASMAAVAIVMIGAGVRRVVGWAMVGALTVSAYFMAGGPLPSKFEQRVGDAIATGDIDKAGSYDGRAALVAEAWTMVDDHLLVGLGADEYRDVSVYKHPVHNLHLLMLTEGGLVGYAGLVVLLIVLGLSATNALRFDRPDGLMCTAVFGVLLIFSFSIPHMYTRNWIVPVFLAIAYSVPRAVPSFLRAAGVPPASAAMSDPAPSL